MTSPSRVRIRVTGRVQGVGYRWFVRENARRLGMAGYVRNEPGGAVLLEAEGPADVVETFERAVRRGPEAATVTGVELLPPGTGQLPRPFTVEH